ncbi:MAG: hypothetical protein JXB39_00430 [Deltaproteobacteria bacterium]|nr:hypothetical protein [Deltaproteobacteria bacterium]
MRTLIPAVLLLATACAPEETEPEETWVRATIDGQPYERTDVEGVLFTYEDPNHIQMWSEEPLNAVLFGWDGSQSQTWSLAPVTGWGMPAVYLWGEDHSQWMSISGTFEIDWFNHHLFDTGSDGQIGMAGGTFEATLEDMDIGTHRTVEVTDGAFRCMVTLFEDT